MLLHQAVELTCWHDRQLSFTEIHGDVTISGNNTTLAECVIFGQLTITGVNTVLVNNRFEGSRALSGKNLTCEGNVSFVGDAGAPDATDAGTTDAGPSAVPEADAGTAGSVTCERTNGNGRGRD